MIYYDILHITKLIHDILIILVFAYTLSLIYIFIQYAPVLLDIITPLNVSRPRKFLLVAEYFIDEEKYFYIITIYIAIGVLFIITCLIATETFSLTNALYAFGLFEIAR